MKHLGALVLAALLAPLPLLHAVTVEDLRREYRENPLGMDVVIQYCTYDVTTLLKQGSNALGMMLGNGWFSASNILS